MVGLLFRNKQCPTSTSMYLGLNALFRERPFPRKPKDTERFILAAIQIIREHFLGLF